MTIRSNEHAAAGVQVNGAKYGAQLVGSSGGQQLAGLGGGQCERGDNGHGLAVALFEGHAVTGRDRPRAGDVV